MPLVTDVTYLICFEVTQIFVRDRQLLVISQVPSTCYFVCPYT